MSKDLFIETKKQISDALKNFQGYDLSGCSTNLFTVLGYNVTRQNPLDEKTFKCLRESYPIEETGFNNDRAFTDDWGYTDLLFQITKTELSSSFDMFDTYRVDDKIIESYLFFVIELRQENYSRTKLAQITREVNKIFPMPVMILFKYNNKLTLSIIERRINKKDSNKDVLRKVTLIKDVSIINPHRAHIDILFELSMHHLNDKDNKQIKTFVDLEEAWRKTLDTKELNKRFYNDLFYWYLWAVKTVKFPQIRPKEDMIPNEAHQSESVIRLITRILFCWFMKEKQELIPAKLFDLNEMEKILVDFSPKKAKSAVYYRAILQNLFFATLSVPIENRKYVKESFQGKNQDYGNPLVFRYQKEFLNPKENLKLFEGIPFLNGGLFECLDKPKADDNKIEIRLDGFSTKEDKQAFVPDILFWGEKSGLDFSKELGKANKNNETARGLFDILDSYKFTIEENTPLEEEIALDPELLGKVFESLLAYYNPETKENARKQTGSFYTPREIVNYMVEESLIAAFEEKLKEKVVENNTEERLRNLLAYDNNINPFDETETKALIESIKGLKILDPACGSGAFPMGILHKLVFILQKIDPENVNWLETIASNLPEEARSDMLLKLKEENWDYIRKLGIILHSIYGIDIQPIAIQIAKLRFFISLLVDQKIDRTKNNLGIKPLPNLDFKLVAANTLIGAPEENTSSDGMLNLNQDNFFDEFHKYTDEYFNVSEPNKKKNLTKKIEAIINKKVNDKIERVNKYSSHSDERFSKHIAERNKNLIGKINEDIKLWKSYTNLFKHESVGFFDTKYFFPEVKDGFDIVIGNPPYGATYSDDQKNYFQSNYKSAKTIKNIQKGSLDTFSLFIEQAYNVIRKYGCVNFIVPMAITSSDSMTGLHNILENNCSIIRISSYSNRPKQIFDNACIRTSILFFIKSFSKIEKLLTTKLIRRKSSEPLDKIISSLQFIDSYSAKLRGRYPKISTEIELAILKKIFENGIPLYIFYKVDGEPIYYRAAGGRYFNVVSKYPTGSTQERSILLKDKTSNAVGAVLSSDLFYFYQQVYSDGLHLKSYEIDNFPLPEIDEKLNKKIGIAYDNYLLDIDKNIITHKVSNYSNCSDFREYKINKSKLFIDKIDDLICPLYGLNDKEIDYIKNYEIEFRLKDDADEY